MEYGDHEYSPSLKHKLKTTIICNACCNYSDNEEDDDQKALKQQQQHKLSTWIRSELPEIKEKCASLFSGKLGRHRHRGNAAEFRYDPMSYALNFEDDDSRIDEFPLSARFPASPPPPQKKNVVVSREIAAWS